MSKLKISFSIDATGKKLEGIDPAETQWGIFVSKPEQQDDGDSIITATFISNNARVEKLYNEQFLPKVEDATDGYDEDKAYQDAVALDVIYMFEEVETLANKYREFLGLE